MNIARPISLVALLALAGCATQSDLDVVRRDNKIAVFRNGGDLLHAGSTRSLGNAVKDACQVIVGPQAAQP